MTERYPGRDLEAMSFASNYARWVRDLFAPFLRGELCEVGAGSGNFTSLLATDAVTSITALEPSADMFPLLAARVRDAAAVETVQGTLAALPAQRRFDTFVYNNVLEHIGDDAGELAAVRERLRPGGHVCIFVPALPCLMSDFDRSIGHVRRYRRRELAARLQGAGLGIVRLHYFDAPGILPWLVSMRWLKGGLDERKVRLYDRYAVPAIRALESLIRPPIGRNLVAIARRIDDR